MCSLKDTMTRTVYQFTLGTGKIAPQHKDYALTIIGDISYHCICKLLPSDLAVRGSLGTSDCKNCVQQKDSLTCLVLQIRITAHADAKISLYLLEYIL